MSIRLMSIVWELDIGQSQSKVLMVLCDHADDVPGQPGVGINCFPSLTKISWKTGYTRRGVQKVLDRLEKDELIVCLTQGSGHKNSQYEIHLENAKKKEPLRGERRSSQGRTAFTSEGRTAFTSEGRTAFTGERRSPVNGGSSQGRTARPPIPPSTHPDPPPLATTLFSPAAGSPNNNVFETYISEVGKIFAHLPGAIPSQTDRQIVERWFASKVAIPTVKLGLVEGMLRHISGPNYDRTVNLAYFVSIVDEYAKSPRAVPPHIVDFRYTRLPDYLKERPNFPRANWMIPELEEATS